MASEPVPQINTLFPSTHAPTQPQQSSPRRAHHKPVYLNLEKNEIPFALKQLLIEESPMRNDPYRGEKVYARNEMLLQVKDAKTIALERAKRIQDSSKSGFCSDPREVYQPLGRLIIDSEALMYDALQIQVKTVSNNRSQQLHTQVTPPQPILQNKRGTGPQHTRTNGFDIIRDRIQKSKVRLQAVKFGVPFLSLVPEQAVERLEKSHDSMIVNDVIDWKSPKIDIDRQIYYSNLLYSEKQRNKPDKVSLPIVPVKPPPRRVSSPSASEIKHMEQALNICGVVNVDDSISRLSSTRENYYEQRHRLTQLLKENLNRVEYDSGPNFVRKFQSLSISQNVGYVDDLSQMRKKANLKRIQEKKIIIKNHPWYNDLIKIVYGNKRKTCEYERLLVDRIRGVIEDQQPFSQKTFIKILCVLPKTEFQRDELQRVIRFIKQHESISERDYVEAIELAGHELK